MYLTLSTLSVRKVKVGGKQAVWRFPFYSSCIADESYSVQLSIHLMHLSFLFYFTLQRAWMEEAWEEHS